MKKVKQLFALLAFVMIGIFAFSSITFVHAEDDATYDFSTGTYDSDAKTITWSNTGLTILQEKNTASSAPNSDYISEPRWYKNNLITFTPLNNAAITEMVFTCSSENYATSLATATWSSGTAAASSTVVTWTGSASEEFAVNMAVGMARILSMTYSYTEVMATSVSIDETLELGLGESKSLAATVLPTTTTDKSVSWTSSDTGVATVDSNGLVSAVAVGTATITVTVNKVTSLTDTCTVTVSQAENEDLASFQSTDLQEQLAFHYSYSTEYQAVTALAEGTNYHLGNIYSNTIYAVNGTPVNQQMTSTSDLSTALTFTLVANGDNYYLISGTYYIGSKDGETDVIKGSESDATADTTNVYLWSFDSSNGKITNVGTSRYLAFTDETYSAVKCYSNSKPVVTFLTTNGDVTFTDAASTANAVTMRIGYTMSKTLYNSIVALGSTVEFGVYLNNKTYVACTAIEEDSTTYRFYVSVDGITLANLSKVLTASGYVKVDTDYYYTTDVNSYSAKTLAIEYLTNYADNAAVIASNYALTYLAYNA